MRAEVEATRRRREDHSTAPGHVASLARTDPGSIQKTLAAIAVSMRHQPTSVSGRTLPRFTMSLFSAAQ